MPHPAGGEEALTGLIGPAAGQPQAPLYDLRGTLYRGVERHEELASLATDRLAQLGFTNVSVRHGDGTLGWAEHAPFDAIVVAAGGPKAPEALLDQLAPGGRLVIPVGEGRGVQQLLRITREADGSLRREDLGDVRFVPLIGAQGWARSRPSGTAARPRRRCRRSRDARGCHVPARRRHR